MSLNDQIAIRNAYNGLTDAQKEYVDEVVDAKRKAERKYLKGRQSGRTHALDVLIMILRNEDDY